MTDDELARELVSLCNKAKAAYKRGEGAGCGRIVGIENQINNYKNRHNVLQQLVDNKMLVHMPTSGRYYILLAD